MKITLITFILITTFIPIKNFTVTQNKVEWTTIHQTESTASDISKHFQSTYNASKIDTTLLYFEMQGKLDLEGAGFTKMNAPIICQSDFTATITIEIKNSKYKATARNIKLQSLDDTYTLEQFAIKRNGDYKNIFKKSLSKVINHTLTNQTTFVPKEDW